MPPFCYGILGERAIAHSKTAMGRLLDLRMFASLRPVIVVWKRVAAFQLELRLVRWWSSVPASRGDHSLSARCCGGNWSRASKRFRDSADSRGPWPGIYDQTGLTGRYDFTLDYGKYIEASDEDHVLNALQQARFDAMRELGLEVVEAKMQVDTFVVDRVAKIPTEN